MMFPLRSPNLNLHPLTRPQPRTAPAPPTPRPMQAPATPTERLAAIIAWLAGCVAEQGSRQRLAGPLVVAIWTRLRRISAQFLAVAATPIPPARPAPAGHNTAPRPASPPPAARPPRRPPVMPYGARWLLRLIPGAAASLSQLETLLRDPEMAALLAADPRMGRILRALCWMLGVHPSLAPPPRRRRGPPTPAIPPDAPDPGQAAALECAAPWTAPLARRARRKRFNLRGRDLLTRLRMGPSSIWA